MNRDKSFLLLVDFQPEMFAKLDSKFSPSNIRFAAKQVVTAARIARVPVFCSQISSSKNGKFLEDISQGNPVVEREIPGFDITHDPSTMYHLCNSSLFSGRNQIILSGLWTSMCFAFSALSLSKLGFQVFGLMDAAGDTSVDAHKYAIERMVHRGGVEPVTWMPVVASWMETWDDRTAEAMKKFVWSKLPPPPPPATPEKRI
jgi:nicotinamidase-related amidase